MEQGRMRKRREDKREEFVGMEQGTNEKREREDKRRGYEEFVGMEQGTIEKRETKRGRERGTSTFEQSSNHELAQLGLECPLLHPGDYFICGVRYVGMIDIPYKSHTQRITPFSPSLSSLYSLRSPFRSSSDVPRVTAATCCGGMGY